MKKGFGFIALFIFLFSVNVFNVSAECSVSKKDIKDIKVNFERYDGELQGVSFNITNIPDNVKVIVKDSDGNEIISSDVEPYFYSAGDSNVLFYCCYDYSSGKKLKYELYSTCDDKMLKSDYINKDNYNKYSENEDCIKYNNSSKYCELFTDKDYSKVSEEKILKSIKKGIVKDEFVLNDVNSNGGNGNNLILDILYNNCLYFIIPFVSIIVIVIVILIIVKKRRSKKNEED